MKRLAPLLYILGLIFFVAALSEHSLGFFSIIFLAPLSLLAYSLFWFDKAYSDVKTTDLKIFSGVGVAFSLLANVAIFVLLIISLSMTRYSVGTFSSGGVIPHSVKIKEELSLAFYITALLFNILSHTGNKSRKNTKPRR